MEEFIFGFVFNDVFNSIITAASAGIAGFFIAKVTHLTKKERARMVVDKCTSRKYIFDAYERYIVKAEHMSTARYDELLDLYDAYKTLGGNGTAERYMDEIRQKNPYLITQ